MGILTKFVGFALIGFTTLYIFRDYILIPIAIIFILFLIRIIADVYWRGKEDGKW